MHKWASNHTHMTKRGIIRAASIDRACEGCAQRLGAAGANCTHLIEARRQSEGEKSIDRRLLTSRGLKGAAVANQRSAS